LVTKKHVLLAKDFFNKEIIEVDPFFGIASINPRFLNVVFQLLG
jgi:hypothetical protein